MGEGFAESVAAVIDLDLPRAEAICANLVRALAQDVRGPPKGLGDGIRLVMTLVVVQHEVFRYGVRGTQ